MISLLADSGASMPVWSVLPFLGLLLSIAVIPLVREHWWHENHHKAIVSLLFGVPVAVYVAFRDPGALAHAGLEYVAFVCLLGSLYIISGGVRLRGSLPGTPASNAALLAFGAVLANVTGTTGAAMLLLRPYLHANRQRKNKVHLVVFFILVVANCGGCLTPLGDPPLFMGFLKGVPFTWTLALWKEWLVVCGCLVAVFYFFDRARHRADGAPLNPRDPVALEGGANLGLLAAVVGAILAGGFWVKPRWGETAAQVFQSALMAGFAGLSRLTTPRARREANEFSWHPLMEVLVLFVGIFAAMIPALSVLREHGAALGLARPAAFLWVTGGLSACLDNAPTYVAFLSMAQYLPDEVAGTTQAALAAISCGAVFFGALTYIGNGPNFIVKAAAEHAGVRMPSFFGYMAWAAALLLPVLGVVTLLFFR
ncbi:MAG TPA: sodium:proton antiporter [Planctomycetota bacterium]|nr:sodium:proton antiporter [Planctomycetota bacterium]